MLTALLSFVAGLLTVLAPCVLPLLPIILGGSFAASDRDKRRPYIITASLVASLITFTILLKASTALIGIDPRVWMIVAGGIVILLGLFMLLPDLWARLIGNAGIESRSQGLLSKAFKQQNKTLAAVLTGAALGPVFSSCSPTYAWVIATVLPANTVLGVVYLSIYCLGVAIALLAIALLGRKLLERIQWASNPKGWFQRCVAILFILVGVFVITGWDKKVQTWLVDRDFLNLIRLEQKLVPDNDRTKKKQPVNSASYFNVTPYQAPGLTGTGAWFNSRPLSLEELRGKVVLIDFWTFSCINCIRTLPYLQQWYDTYKDEGFVIIGVHAPEFAFEKVPANLERAIQDHKLTYPIVQDNDFKTWRAYDNNSWPAHYLIDKDGRVRREHFGEGEYDETEKAIRALLAESGHTPTKDMTIRGNTEPPISRSQTPETYLGYQRGERLANRDEYKPDQTVQYHVQTNLDSHTWSLGGAWQIGPTESVSKSDTSTLRIKFSAKDAYLVMGGNGQPVQATLNGQKVTASVQGGSDVDADGNIFVKEPRLYRIIHAQNFIKDGILELTFPKNITVNAFTFGS